ncbi:MAG TPA: hypothetical protein VMT29_09140 [Steroidobacteraceae bacterium]|nr:hypothetical protein [Steroidobacteraceae bacterium]
MSSAISQDVRSEHRTVTLFATLVGWALVGWVLLAWNLQAQAANAVPAPSPAAGTSAAPSPAATSLPGPALQSAAPGIRIAHSSLVTVDGTPSGDTLVLDVRRVSNGSRIASDDIALTVDGKNEPLTHLTDSTYSIEANELRDEGDHDLELIVGHDGIREILTGKISLPESSSTGSLIRDHKQMAWWILNVVIVLVAAIALSRRRS